MTNIKIFYRNLPAPNANGPKKTIIIGDSNVGKTSILLRLVRNEFDDQSMPTLGAGFKTKEVTYYDMHTERREH